MAAKAPVQIDFIALLKTIDVLTELSNTNEAVAEILPALVAAASNSGYDLNAYCWTIFAQEYVIPSDAEIAEKLKEYMADGDGYKDQDFAEIISESLIAGETTTLSWRDRDDCLSIKEISMILYYRELEFTSDSGGRSFTFGSASLRYSDGTELADYDISTMDDVPAFIRQELKEKGLLPSQYKASAMARAG